jgi:MFS transporter, PPP family, 3-phenylpropionic acid transporter
MAPLPGITAPDGFAWRLSAFYAAFFVYTGITLPFLPVWLAAKGLDAGAIGLVLAVPMLVRPVVVPLATRLADRFALLREGLMIAAWAGTAGLLVLGWADRFVTLLAAQALASVFLAPIMPLVDAYALRGLRTRRGSYGAVRLWGSVTFILANLAGGVALSMAGAGRLIWILVAAQAVAAASALMLVPLAERPAPAGPPATRPTLWKSPLFIAMLIATSLIQASHGVLYGFATLLWTAEGFGGPAVGALWSIGVVAEVALFAFAGRIVPRVGALGLVILGGVGAIVRWGGMALDPPSLAQPFLQSLHALSFAATHLGTMAFLAEIAGPTRSATVQGDYVAVQGIVFSIVMVASGTMVERIGVAAYAAMIVVAAAGTGVAIVARRAWSAPDRLG